MYKNIFSIFRSVYVSVLKKKDKEEMSVIKRFCSNSFLASMIGLSKQHKIVVFLKGFTSFLLRRSFLDETGPKGNETKLAKGKWFNERRDTIHLPAQCQPLSLGKTQWRKGWFHYLSVFTVIIITFRLFNWQVFYPPMFFLSWEEKSSPPCTIYLLYTLWEKISNALIWRKFTDIPTTDIQGPILLHTHREKMYFWM